MSHPANKQTEVLIHEQYSFHGLLHRESKKQAIKLLAVTSLTIIRFSTFFHYPMQ